MRTKESFLPHFSVVIPRRISRDARMGLIPNFSPKSLAAFSCSAAGGVLIPFKMHLKLFLFLSVKVQKKSQFPICELVNSLSLPLFKIEDDLYSRRKITCNERLFLKTYA